MKIKFLLAALIMLGCVTCSKDTFNTTPSLKFVSVNGSVFPQHTQVIFKLEFTDKEGDINDTIWVQRISTAAACSTQNLSFSDSLPIPDVGSQHNIKGEFQLTYLYPPSGSDNTPSLNACSLNDDTSYFRFWMHDKALHVSDTVQSPSIVLLKQ